MGNPVTAMSGLGSFEAASSENGRAITIHLAGESARVGIALGYRVPKFNGESVERWADCARELPKKSFATEFGGARLHCAAFATVSAPSDHSNPCGSSPSVFRACKKLAP